MGNTSPGPRTPQDHNRYATIYFIASHTSFNAILFIVKQPQSHDLCQRLQNAVPGSILLASRLLGLFPRCKSSFMNTAFLLFIHINRCWETFLFEDHCHPAPGARSNAFLFVTMSPPPCDSHTALHHTFLHPESFSSYSRSSANTFLRK
jgi:hypothetical protein